MKLHFHNRFTKLKADPQLTNQPRAVLEAMFSYVHPKKTAKPEVILTSGAVAELIGLDEQDLKSDSFKNVCTGNAVWPDSKPYAMCYGGHQFGHWAGQLGDGRAINLGEVLAHQKHWALQLKGAGPTPYSRTADGLAVLRSSIREFLASEAMYALGVPTTRALSLALTGDHVLRDMLYDGHPAYEKGAVVCRVAENFIRFGNFEIFSSRQDLDSLRQLTDYTIKHHYPHLGEPSKAAYLGFFEEVAQRTLSLMIHWERVGFVHGVMNTDNLSISGLTIDFGPYGWLDDYDPNWTPNTTDAQNKRYRYGNQAQIGLWNLLQLANALYPLVEESDPLVKVLDQYKTDYTQAHQHMMCTKIGLFSQEPEDQELISSLRKLLTGTQTDMTIFFRNLSKISAASSFESFEVLLKESLYEPLKSTAQWSRWFMIYTHRLTKEADPQEQRAQKMNLINPKYVLRNYMNQLAIDDAQKGDYGLLTELHELLKAPYSEQPNMQKWFAKRPDWARNKVGCSALSCSS